MSNEAPKKFRRHGEHQNEPCCAGHGQKCTDCGYTKEEFSKKIEDAKQQHRELLHKEYAKPK